MNFQTHRTSNFGDSIETVSVISTEEIGKLGLPIPGASLHCFHKKEYIGQLAFKREIFMCNHKFEKLGFL